MSASEEFTDYYQILQLDNGADLTEVKKAYFDLAKQTHPDAGGSTEAMQVLNRAYRTLSDPAKRPAYDKLYNMHNRIETDDLELKEDDYEISSSKQAGNTGLEDLFVDQLYSEYYTPKKKPGWKGKFKRK